MKKLLTIALALILCIPAAAMAAGKATVTQEAFYKTPFLGYFAGEVFCEVTNTGDRPVRIESGVYEFFDTEGESIDSGSIYHVYPRVLLPGEKGYITIQGNVKEAKEPAYIDDYSVSIVGKSAKAEEAIRYTVSDVLMGEYGAYSLYKAFYVDVTNNSDTKSGDISVVFGAYDADGTLLFACHGYTIGMSLLPGSTIEVYCTIDNDILNALEASGKTIATVTATAFED